jgi:hypothetical protein
LLGKQSTTPNTAFADEAKFLFESSLVSAHYLVGKDGAVVRFLDPKRWAAWHAGNARTGWGNDKSIGIELHHSVGDPPYPAAQFAALGALLASLSALFNIPFGMVETHGQIAIAGPYDRKHDPSDWPHADFIRWRDSLAQIPPPVSPPSARYRASGVPIHEAPDVTSPVALGGMAILAPGTEIQPDQIKDGWAHVPEGFIDAKALEAI